MKTTIELNKGRLRGGKQKTLTDAELKAKEKERKKRKKRRYDAQSSRTAIFFEI